MEILKFKYIRSKVLMEMYRTISCQCCGTDNGTVCGAHSNQAKHGKGRGIKASDEFCASLCSYCHNLLDDDKRLPRADRVIMWDRAYVRTKAALTAKFAQKYTTLISI